MAETIAKELNIIHININSLINLSRRYNLSVFLNNNNPDLVLINETKLNSKHKLNFENYNFIRNDRKNAKRGGGTAILIRKGIKYSHHSNKNLNLCRHLETSVVKIPFCPNKTLFIIAAYYPSGNNCNLFKSELLSLFQTMNLENTDNYYILAGDLNCRHTDWKNSESNTKGNHLK